MVGKQSAAVIAIIGGVLSAALLAMLAALPGARADELSDLRVNQELLQQRLDQLSQASGASAAGTTVTAGSFPRSFLVPGTDTSLRIGGFAQTQVVYYLNGMTTNGDSFNSAGNSQTCPDGVGANCALPSIPLDLHGQNISGSIENYNVQGNGHSRGSYFGISPRYSQIFFDARTPTPWGEVKAYLEFDFAASSAGNDSVYSNLTAVSNGWIPRLRKAYGTLGGLLIGQDNGSLRDVSSEGEFVSSGDEGYAGRYRAGTARYTWTDLPYGMTVAVSANDPVSEGITPDGNIYEDTNDIPGIGGCSSTATANLTTTLSTVACLNTSASYNPFQNVMPDWIATWRIDQDWGHVQLGGALKEDTLNDGRYLNQNIIGGGFYLSGDIRPFYTWQGPMELDDLGWGFGGGPGIGSLISDCYSVVTNYGPPNLIASNANGGGAATIQGQDANRAYYDSGVKTKNVTCYGAHADAVHWWTSELRTNLTFGVTRQVMDTHLIEGPNCITTDATAGLNNCGGGAAANINKDLLLANVNLFWTPVPFVDIGVEYTWGHRVTLGNLRGDANVIGGIMKVRF